MRNNLASHDPVRFGQLPSQTEGMHDAESSDSSTEVVDINPHTRDIEFHGNTSSVAFLDRVREDYANESVLIKGSRQRRGSIISTFHNDTFPPQQDSIAAWYTNSEDHFFTPQSYIFLDTYFNNLHYIHPIIDQTTFLRRCDDLWRGNAVRQSRSFIALYFSIMSLGALIRTWNEQKILGMGRFEWSRMLFEKAQIALGRPGTLNDLEAVQAYFIMAKVCQNEISPNLAYTYLGMAIRTSLSTGINRNTAPKHTDGYPNADLMSRTWWGLYSLEVELSFALGRPDSLGMDEYHTRPMPPVDDSEIAILTRMIDMSHIMRAVSVAVYLHKIPLAHRLARALQIRSDMIAWIGKLPARIRPSIDGISSSGGTLEDPQWVRLQRMVLQIR